MSLELIRGNQITFVLECRRGDDREQNLGLALEIKVALKETGKAEGDAADIELTSPDAKIQVDSPEIGFLTVTFDSDDTGVLVLNDLLDLAAQAKFAADNFVEWNEPRAVKVVRQIIANA